MYKRVLPCLPARKTLGPLVHGFLLSNMTNTVTKAKDAAEVPSSLAEFVGRTVQSRRDGPTADDRLRRRNGGENSAAGLARPLCWNDGEKDSANATLGTHG